MPNKSKKQNLDTSTLTTYINRLLLFFSNLGIEDQFIAIWKFLQANLGMKGIAYHDNSNSNISRLPTELITSILHHLCAERPTLRQCTLVSKHFYDITTPILWKEFFLYCFDFEWFLHALDKLSPERVSIITQHIEYLFVHIRSRSHDSDENAIRLDQFLRILRYIPYLNRLNLTKSTYEPCDTPYQQIPYYCQHLTALKLENISTESFLSSIAQNCHQLTFFDWTLYGPLESAEWLVFLKDCPLKKLRIKDWKLDLGGNVLSIMQGFHQLTYLIIQFPTPQFTKQMLLFPPTTVYWPQLELLILTQCQDIDDTTFIEFIQCHPHLRHLELYDTQLLTDISLNAMTKWIPHITHLTWSPCSMYYLRRPVLILGVIRQFIRRCRYLKYIMIGKDEEITFEHFMDGTDSTTFYGKLESATIQKIRRNEFK